MIYDTDVPAPEPAPIKVGSRVAYNGLAGTVQLIVAPALGLPGPRSYHVDWDNGSSSILERHEFEVLEDPDADSQEEIDATREEMEGKLR